MLLGCCWEAAIPSTSNNHTKASTRKEPASGAKAGRCEAIAGAGITKETKLNLKIYILTCYLAGTIPRSSLWGLFIFLVLRYVRYGKPRLPRLQHSSRVLSTWAAHVSHHASTWVQLMLLLGLVPPDRWPCQRIFLVSRLIEQAHEDSSALHMRSSRTWIQLSPVHVCPGVSRSAECGCCAIRTNRTSRAVVQSTL